MCMYDICVYMFIVYKVDSSTYKLNHYQSNHQIRHNKNTTQLITSLNGHQFGYILCLLLLYPQLANFKASKTVFQHLKIPLNTCFLVKIEIIIFKISWWIKNNYKISALPRTQCLKTQQK